MSRGEAFLDTTRPSLLLRLRDRRDAAAWRTFDEIYRPMLQRFALACGLGHADAEDIVQQCLLAVGEHIENFEYDPTRGRFKSWLRTMVNNRVRNLLRDRRNDRGDPAAMAGIAARETAPEEVFDRLWLQEHLWHCLRLVQGEVEATTYEAFVRYVIEERSVEEVCAELGIRPNLLYTIKWRVTERIAGKMSELLGDED